MLEDTRSETVKANSISYTLTLPPPPIRMLAFKGGGAKGVAHVGAIEALFENGVMPQVESVAGSSAGALCALGLALGMTAEEIKDFINNEDFLSYIDIQPDITARGICNSEKLYHKTQLLIALYASKLQLQALRHLQKELDACPNLSDQANAIKKTMQQIEAINIEHFTFADLSLLKKTIPGNKAKNLLITGTNISDQCLEIFSAENTPHMEIATACRISIALPIVFKAVSYNEKQYIDGGASDNLPIRHLEKFQQQSHFDFLDQTELSQQTLSFLLGDMDKEIFKEDYQPYQTGLLAAVKSYLLQSICKVDYMGNLAQLRESLRNNYNDNRVVLDSHNVSTTSFNLSLTQKEDLQKCAKEKLKEHLRQRAPVKKDYPDYLSFLLSVPYNLLHPTLLNQVALQHVESLHISQAQSANVLTLRQTEKEFLFEIREQFILVNALFSAMAELEKQKTDEKLLGEAVDEDINTFSTLITQTLNDIAGSINNHFEQYEKAGISLEPHHQKIILSRIEMACASQAEILIKNTERFPNILSQTEFTSNSDLSPNKILMNHFKINTLKQDIFDYLHTKKSLPLQSKANLRYLERTENLIKNTSNLSEIDQALNDTINIKESRVLNFLLKWLPAWQKRCETHTKKIEQLRQRCRTDA